MSVYLSRAGSCCYCIKCSKLGSRNFHQLLALGLGLSSFFAKYGKLYLQIRKGSHPAKAFNESGRAKLRFSALKSPHLQDAAIKYLNNI